MSETPQYRYAIIGTGRQRGTEGATGFGMAHLHYHGFMETGQADLVAIADIRDDNAQLFLDRYESKARHYRDYLETDVDRLPMGEVGSRREWAIAYFRLNPEREAFDLIGAYNGHTDLGETLGYFTLDEAQEAFAAARQ